MTLIVRAVHPVAFLWFLDEKPLRLFVLVTRIYPESNGHLFQQSCYVTWRCSTVMDLDVNKVPFDGSFLGKQLFT